MKLAKQRPDYYSVEKYGIPINDLDSIATIGTFSGTLIWLSLPRQGIWLRKQETLDYIALWRYIAYVIGCPTEYFETPAKAKAMMESLLMNEIDPTETSKVLANNIIKSLEDRPPTWASSDMLVVSARWLNGNELCDRLGLARPGLYYWSLMAGQCVFFMFMCYVYRSIPRLDQYKIRNLRRIFYSMIVESSFGLQGKETTFELKYVPEFSTITEMGQSEEPSNKSSGVERRNLKALVLATGFLSIGTWCSVKIVSGIMGAIWR